MIVRVFRAVVHDGKQEEFARFFLHTAIPLLNAQKGMLGVSVGRPLPTSPNEFLMVTRWADLDALRGFSGEDWSQAVIDPAQEHLLMETYVHHYEAVEA